MPSTREKVGIKVGKLTFSMQALIFNCILREQRPLLGTNNDNGIAEHFLRIKYKALI